MLKGWHLLIFFGGLTFDTLGTERMGRLAGGFTFNLHSVTGALALSLMFVHALWALFVYLRKDETALKTFHRFSLAVWVFWLVPYGLGLVVAVR